MRKIFLILILPFTISYAQYTYTYLNEGILKFSDGTEILPAGQIISSPCVADWNGDGRKDLIVGYFIEGLVYCYINSGTNSAPIFNKQNYYRLQAGGADISVPYG